MLWRKYLQIRKKCVSGSDFELVYESEILPFPAAIAYDENNAFNNPVAEHSEPYSDASHSEHNPENIGKAHAAEEHAAYADYHGESRVARSAKRGGKSVACGPYSHCEKCVEHYYLFGEACGFGRKVVELHYERQEQQYEHAACKVKEINASCNTVVVVFRLFEIFGSHAACHYNGYASYGSHSGKHLKEHYCLGYGVGGYGSCPERCHHD